ncbi:MAG: DnaB-like helicase C-terminal domain-containing protein [Thermodesulfobacteriota bacterium]
MEQNEAVSRFYVRSLTNVSTENTILTADCPFCAEKGLSGTRRFVVFLNVDGFFHGYFRCLNRCVPGGFPLWFGALAGVDPSDVPGFIPDREPWLHKAEYPAANLNNEIKSYESRMSDELIDRYSKAGIGRELLREMQVGYNGRYLVFPYIQDDGNCYSARCVFPDRPEDFFWHGDENFFGGDFQVFNSREIHHCENGTLFICQGEENLLTIRQLGFPGIAVPDSRALESLSAERLGFVRTIFISTPHNSESEAAARSLAAKIGYKVRLLKWPVGQAKNFTLWQLASENSDDFKQALGAMVKSSRAFSPFPSPARELSGFHDQLRLEGGDSYSELKSGFSLFDDALGGVHGINVIGGPPKTGKSSFMIQIATEMALKKIPVLYYDFENGRQKLYQRTLCRLSRLTAEKIRTANLQDDEQESYRSGCSQLQELLYYFRVVNDRKLSPKLMRRHIDFLRHETRSDYTVVVIDSLHKLPFKEFGEKRSGIDGWLRQMESIRDELQVSFLVISELSRGEGGSYSGTPHLGVFKGSGDIEYSADNALVLYPDWDPLESEESRTRQNKLWLVASREHSPGLIGCYNIDYPYWGFVEEDQPVDGS